MLPKIKLFALGGTISAHHELADELRQYRVGHYSAEQLLTAIPEIAQTAIVDIEQIDAISSTGITMAHWLDLHQRISQCLASDYAGVVITHGTNTMEETAYYLHLTIASEKPIVLTGSQRPFSAISSDAQLNLLNAVRAAASPACHGLGTVICMNDKLYSARDVSKTHSYHVESFRATNNGPLGSIDPDRKVRIDHKPARKHSTNSVLSGQQPNTEPYVPIIYSYAGADQRLLDSVLELHSPAGIVIAGTGAGRCSPLEEQAVAKARQQGIPVVMSSRLASGRILPIECYDYLPLISADNLPPAKARILLLLALQRGLALEQIQQLFETH